jgi:hypothetical protein
MAFTPYQRGFLSTGAAEVLPPLRGGCTMARLERKIGMICKVGVGHLSSSLAVSGDLGLGCYWRRSAGQGSLLQDLYLSRIAVI